MYANLVSTQIMKRFSFYERVISSCKKTTNLGSLSLKNHAELEYHVKLVLVELDKVRDEIINEQELSFIE